MIDGRHLLEPLALELFVEAEHGPLVGARVEIAGAAAAGGEFVVRVGVGGRVRGLRRREPGGCEVVWGRWAGGVAGAAAAEGHLGGGGWVRLCEADGHNMCLGLGGGNREDL